MSTTDLPGAEGVVKVELMAHLSQAGRSGLSPERLLDLVGERFDGAAVSRALGDLELSGDAVLWNGTWIAVSATDWLVGRVGRLDRGDAVLRTGRGGEAGYFIRRESLKRASDGDLVVARRSVRARRRRRAYRLPEASVMKVLRPQVRNLVGCVERTHGRLRLVDFDPRTSLDARLVGATTDMVGAYVVCEIESSPSPRSNAPRAVVREVLGDISTPGVDILATLRHFAIPDEFPSEVESRAKELPENPDATDFEDREDLRRRVVVTIDGASARDFDDAISVEAGPEGGFRLGVHIADVSHYVHEGDVVDAEAYSRGTSVYFPDRSVPMLPESLSSGLCSLLPGVPRLTLSAILDVASDGSISRHRFAKTVIQSRRRMTYDEVRRILEDPRESDEAELGEVLPMLERAERLMRKFFARRLARGSIDFDLPEGDVVLDLDGAAVGVRPGERNVAHRMIEEFMIAANEAVARELEGCEQPALFRVHEEPDRARLEELREVLAPLGVELDLGGEFLHPSALQAILGQVEGTAAEPFVASLVLRAMTRARYDPECKGHYALSSRFYTHFTSPIRRYPDLLVHRQLKALQTREKEPSDPGADLRARLPAIAEHVSGMEARAERAERVVLQWKVVRMLAGREGETFAARVTGVKPYGMFVQLENLFVDGLLPLAHLRDDFYEYRPQSHELVGKKGRSFKLADKIAVLLHTVDVTKRRLLLDLPERTEGVG